MDNPQLAKPNIFAAKAAAIKPATAAQPAANTAAAETAVAAATQTAQQSSLLPLPDDQFGKACAYLGKNIVLVRPWHSRRDGQDYITATVKPVVPGGGYNSIQEIAEDLLQTARDNSIYVSYIMNVNGQRKRVRLIALTNEVPAALVFAVESEYIPTNVQAGITQFSRSQNSPAIVEEANIVAEDIGFGKLRG